MNLPKHFFITKDGEFSLMSDLSTNWNLPAKKFSQPSQMIISVLMKMDFASMITQIMAGFKIVKELTGILGRWQIIENAPMIVCDVGHNEEGIQISWLIK